MNSDTSQRQAVMQEKPPTSSRFPDPMETVLEAAARLRVLERLLQHALAAEAATERRALLLRYNRLRRELLARLDGAPTGRTGLPQEPLEASITGPLRQDSNDQTINTAVDSIHRLLDRLIIS